MPLEVQRTGSTVLAGAGRPNVAGGRGRMDIGLVNNMPDSALRATERQFARRLVAASGERDVRLHFFALPSVLRGPAARAHMRGRYGDIDALRAARLDALIVTGAEPLAPSLTDEVYWDDMARLVDWAEGNTTSTIWSCLAAHAAVLHLDGVGRRRLPSKRFGLFECVRAAGDRLFEGAPPWMRIPHSRWNDVTESDLGAHGYRIASRSGEAGVDTFTKQWGSLFVFLQGHPEYDRDTLSREHRRDVQRFLSGGAGSPPDPPMHYFETNSETVASSFASQPGGQPKEAATEMGSSNVWTIRSNFVATWEASAAALYGNWLSMIADRL